MTASPRIGLCLLEAWDQHSLGTAHWAEERGYESVWIPDGMGKPHALTLCGAVAATTERIRIATGIVPVYTHTPAVLAAAVSGMEQIAPGRFTLGLGASSPVMMQDWHGLTFEKPVTRMRETVQVLRQMLAGERVDFEGQTLHSKGFRLIPSPYASGSETMAPIVLAALRPRMLELAGEIADGVILHLVPLRAMPKVLEHIAIGAKRAGRSPEAVEVICRFNVVMDDDLNAAKEVARRRLTPYMYADVYRDYLAWCGYEEQALAAAQALAERDRERAQAAMDDGLLDDLAILGSAERCRERIREFVAAGVGTPTINPIHPDAERGKAAAEALAPEHFA